MTRDYARPSRPVNRNRNVRRKPSRETAPGWLWMVAGMLVGALIMTLVRLDKVEPEPGPPAVEDTDRTSEQRPRFDFYTLLKESEVIVPDPPAPTRETEPESPAPESVQKTAVRKPSPASTTVQTTSTATASSASANREVYLLQAGSFKSSRDADSMRARLLLLNLSASVQQVSPRPGETWHRVLVGPFTSSSGVSEARAMLARNGIDNILLKRKN